MTAAAIYARKSRITEKGASIENQIKICKQYLENMTIDTYRVYKDDGYSGKNTDRPEFLKMLRDARQKQFDILICYKLDRISRNVADFSSMVNELEKLGISFISVNEQFDTSNAMGRAMMYVSSVFAQLERETISQRIKDNMLALAERGNWLGGRAPTGFTSQRMKYIDDTGKEKTFCILSPVKEELDLIELIYKKYLYFKSLSKLEKYMIFRNIKTKNGSDWSITTLKGILTNPAYVKADENIINYFKDKEVDIHGEADGIHGILIYNKRRGKNGPTKELNNWIYSISSHEGIIISEDWIRVQNIIEHNKSRAPALGCSQNALLSGIIKCTKCGGHMRVAYGKYNYNEKTKKYYYVCSLKHNFGKARCDNSNTNGIELDNLIIEKVKGIKLDKETLISELQKYKYELEHSAENIELSNLLRDIKHGKIMIENLINNISLTKDMETAEKLMKRISELSNENKLLESRLNEIKFKAASEDHMIKDYNTFIESVNNTYILIDASSLEEKRGLISSIIEGIYVNGDTGKVTVKFK